jgi:flagellar protein FlaG
MEDFGVGRAASVNPHKVVPEPRMRSTRQDPGGQTVERRARDEAAASRPNEALTSEQAPLEKDRGLQKLLGKQPLRAEERTVLEETQETTSQMNRVVLGLEVDVRFRVSENDTGETVVEVYDRDSGDVLRTIPPEEVLALRERMKDIVGLVIDRVV